MRLVSYAHTLILMVMVSHLTKPAQIGELEALGHNCIITDSLITILIV
jgi:hypothetical protein